MRGLAQRAAIKALDPVGFPGLDLVSQPRRFFMVIQAHNIISEVEPLPYIPGKKRAIINEEPTYDGTEMAQPREVGEGYYVEVNLSWDQKKREMERMADAIGLGITVESTDND